MKFQKIECKDIDYFLSVVKNGSFSKAADELFISQPALTKYIANLEARLGIALLDRSKRPFTLTRAGELYFGYAKEISSLKVNLERELEYAKYNFRETIRIGFACTGLRKIIYNAAQILNEQERVQISLAELTSPEIERQLVSDKLDLGFITLPARTHELISKILLEEDLLLAVPASHPLAAAGSPCCKKEFPTINIRHFSGDSFVLRDSGTRCRTCADRLFAEAGFTPHISTTARNNFSCLEFAEELGACTLITKSFIQNLKSQESMRFFIAGPHPQKIVSGLVYKINHPRSATTYQLIRLIEEMIAAL